MTPLGRIILRSIASAAALAIASAAALANGAAAARPLRCPTPSDLVVTQQTSLRMAGHVLDVVALSIPDANGDAKSRLLVLDRHCHTIWSRTVDGAESRFDRRRLGRTELLHFVTMQVFGDGTGFVHRLLTWRGNRLALMLPPIDHSAKDGFYLGRLAGGGQGVVTWSADPRGESEADAHPYVISSWRWLGQHFDKPVQHETTEKYLASETGLPRADSVARALHLPYRDQTGQRQMMDFERMRVLENQILTKQGGQ